MTRTLRVRQASWIVAAVLVLGVGLERSALADSYEQYAAVATKGNPVIRLGMDTWFLWTAGNQAFWGRAFPVVTKGEVDLLRLLDARVVPRAARFAELGTINDPSCTASTTPDPYGFVMDLCPAQTDANRLKIYGAPTGIIGLRKFPNPGFDSAKWADSGGALGYLKQTEATFDPTLEPPYLIGMACAVCHVGFDPLNPPANPAEPSWANLAPGLGNQYLQEGRVFTIGITDKRQFRYQVGQVQPAGTSDTSRIPSDFLNDPTAINPIFNLGPRLKIRTYERVSASQAAFIKGMTPPIPDDLRDSSRPAMLTAHGLMDGGDSVGLALGSLRVYCNIGGIDFPRFLASVPTQQNGYQQQPFDITAAKANPSSLWTTTEEFMPALQEYLTTFGPMPLSQAPGGSAYLQDSPAEVRRGKIVFADHCARCHSSKQPDPRDHRNRQEAYRRLVLADDFLENNFLSDDRRYPLPLIQTQAARALATNAGEGQVWQDFSSETYKNQPPAGHLSGLFNPLNPRRPIHFRLPEGGRGYYRTSTLVGLWATAPYLHNNSVGAPNSDPSVAGRMHAFLDGLRQLLWPQLRRGRASVAVTTTETYLTDPLGVPVQVPNGLNGSPLPFMIPKGTPIDLYANLHPSDLSKVIAAYLQGGPPAAAAEALKQSRCPDFVADHGHLFGTHLSDRDKYALINYLKRF
ncbi:MAG: hypothetical protein ABI353_02355 [Isosphaeraceae bacterium]